MQSAILKLGILCSLFVGAFGVTQLPESSLLPIVGFVLVLCIGLGWFCMLQSQAVVPRNGFVWVLRGHLQPVPLKWGVPLGFPKAIGLLLVLVSLLLGALVRMLFLAHA